MSEGDSEQPAVPTAVGIIFRLHATLPIYKKNQDEERKLSGQY
jgi:hypothetical protein